MPVNLAGVFNRIQYFISSVKNDISVIDVMKDLYKNSYKSLQESITLMSFFDTIAKGEVIETHYYIRHAIYDDSTPNLKHKILFHINAIFKSTLVQYYNQRYLLQKLKLDNLLSCHLIIEDCKNTVYYYIKKLLRPNTKYDYIKDIEEYFDDTINSTIEDYSRKFQNLYQVKADINHDCEDLFLCKENYDDESYSLNKRVKIYVYKTKKRDIGYDKVRTYDGVYKLYFDTTLKTKIQNWYITDRKDCVKWLKEQLEPYFVPGKGIDVHGNVCGLNYFFNSLSQNKLRTKEYKLLSDFNIRMLKTILKTYIDECIKTMWKDQSAAKKHIENTYKVQENIIETSKEPENIIEEIKEIEEIIIEPVYTEQTIIEDTVTYENPYEEGTNEWWNYLNTTIIIEKPKPVIIETQENIDFWNNLSKG
ncbi:MAG: hypothetical protein MJ211_09780 [Bacteroidales bacterium]|nr:hypothetical protein [Bacteroidales bacterium]